MIEHYSKGRLTAAGAVGKHGMNVPHVCDRFWLIAATIWIVFAIAQPHTCFTQQPQRTVDRNGELLTLFLQRYLTDPRLGIDTTTRISSARVRTGVGDAIVVYVSGRKRCGSGGCTLLTLEPHDSTYKVIGRTSSVRLPVRILSSVTNGRYDIGVWVQGGGIQPGYEALLPFDGRMYPNNPTIPPARRLSAKALGRLLIPIEQDAKHLYE